MDALSIIIALVSVVAGLLQIILFFKVWQMCDDVKAIRKAQNPEAQNPEAPITTNIEQDKIPSSSDKEDNTALIIILSTSFVIIFLSIFFGSDF